MLLLDRAEDEAGAVGRSLVMKSLALKLCNQRVCDLLAGFLLVYLS